MKSIFRRKKYEAVYQIGVLETVYVTTDYVSSILGKMKNNNVMSYKNKNELSDMVIGEYDIDLPLLEVGDEFFLQDIQELVKIKSRTRSSDGSVVYYVEDEIIETENSKTSQEECDKKVASWWQNERKYLDLKNEFDEYKEKYKYKRRFFNFRHS